MEDLVLASLDSVNTFWKWDLVSSYGIFQAVFDVDNLIENIAYKSTDGNVINENFDPYVLEGKFRQAMSILQVIVRLPSFFVFLFRSFRIVKSKPNKISNISKKNARKNEIPGPIVSHNLKNYTK